MYVLQIEESNFLLKSECSGAVGGANNTVSLGKEPDPRL